MSRKSKKPNSISESILVIGGSVDILDKRSLKIDVQTMVDLFHILKSTPNTDAAAVKEARGSVISAITALKDHGEDVSAAVLKAGVTL